MRVDSVTQQKEWSVLHILFAFSCPHAPGEGALAARTPVTAQWLQGILYLAAMAPSKGLLLRLVLQQGSQSFQRAGQGLQRQAGVVQDHAAAVFWMGLIFS